MQNGRHTLFPDAAALPLGEIAEAADRLLGDLMPPVIAVQMANVTHIWPGCPQISEDGEGVILPAGARHILMSVKELFAAQKSCTICAGSLRKGGNLHLWLTVQLDPVAAYLEEITPGEMLSRCTPSRLVPQDAIAPLLGRSKEKIRCETNLSLPAALVRRGQMKDKTMVARLADGVHHPNGTSVIPFGLTETKAAPSTARGTADKGVIAVLGLPGPSRDCSRSLEASAETFLALLAKQPDVAPETLWTLAYNTTR